MSCDEAFLDITAQVKPTTDTPATEPADEDCFNAETDDDDDIDGKLDTTGKKVGLAQKPTAVEFVAALRQEIFEKVQLHASAGIAHNMLLARMCTRVAKPNGQVTPTFLKKTMK